MLKSSKIKLLLALSVLIIAGVATYSTLQTKNKGRPAPGSKDLEILDLQTLKKNDANWTEQTQAVMRLSIQQKPEAFAFIKAKLESKDANLAPWVTRSLGYFNTPESFDLLRVQLQSENSAVRDAAIDALGIRPHPEKLKLLEEAKARSKDSASQARIQMSMIRSAQDPEAKARLARAIVTDLQRKDLDPNSKRILVNEIFFQSPRTREVETYFKTLTANIRKTEEYSAISAIRALKIYCPPNRYALFKEALGRKDLSVTSQSLILNELIFHAGPEAQKVYQDTSSTKGLNPTFLDNLKRQLEKPRIKSPCSP